MFLDISPWLLLDLLPLIKWTYQYYFLDFSLLFLVLSPLGIWTYRRLPFGLIAATFLALSTCVKI